MNLKQYINMTNLLAKSEIEKTVLLAFYYLKNSKVKEFNKEHIELWFTSIDLAKPNIYRLQNNMTKSRKFIRGKELNSFKLHASEIEKLCKDYPQVCERNEDVICLGTILPDRVYEGTRGYIESLSKQINASYEHNIFDGCAVLMRRLLELLLIMSYEKLEIANEIKDANNDYLLLNGIVNNAKTNTTLNLSRNTKSELNNFKKLGNYSAHKIHYNCTKQDIDKVALDYRTSIEELLYIAGIKT